MVLSGREERVLLVFPRGADALLQAGGTIARLVDAGSNAAVLTLESDVATDKALWSMGAHDRRLAHKDARASVSAAIDAQRSSAIVVPALAAGVGHGAIGHEGSGQGSSPEAELIAAAVAEASARHLPVYLAVRGRMPADQRLVAVDVSDQLDAKAAALSTLPGVTVDQRILHVEGSEPRALGSTEQFVMIEGGHADAEPQQSVANRIGTIVLGVIIGALFGAIATVAHQSTIELAGVTVPWGLIVGLISITALLIGLRLVLRDRAVVLAAALGMLATIFVLSLQSMGGSVLVPAGLSGTIWTFAPAIIAAFVISWPRLPERTVARA